MRQRRDARTPPNEAQTTAIVTEPTRRPPLPPGTKRTPLPLTPGTATPTLHEHALGFMRGRRYSPRTIEQYVSWMRRLIDHYGGRHPVELTPQELEGFINYLVIREKVSPSTQNQAIAGLVLLYRDLLGLPYERVATLRLARIPERIHVVLTPAEVHAILHALDGIPRLICKLMYGSGLRIGEAISLRVKDIELDRHELCIFDGKGRKNRTTILPRVIVPELREHLGRLKPYFERERARKRTRVPLPDALARKYLHAATEWPWFWMFPSANVCIDSVDGVCRRFHLHESVVQKAVAAVRTRLGMTKPIRPHDLRHAFATHSMRAGVDPRTLQKLMGHADLKTTLMYLHACDRAETDIASPLDRLSDQSPDPGS